MMTRKQLEALAVRLYMIHNRNRIHKSQKADAMLYIQIKVTKLRMDSIIDMIDNILTEMEVRG